MEKFISKAKNVHGNLYDYSKVIYINNYTKVIIICKDHGEFEQRPKDHLYKRTKCPTCAQQTMGLHRRDTKEQFIDKSKQKFGENRFDYSNVDYKNNDEKVILYCNKHNCNLYITPSNHLRGAGGCKKCRSSNGEITIRNFLINNNIKFEEQKTFENCKYIKNLLFDFYLPDYNIVIEFQGEQHFRPIRYFGGNNGFILTQKRDKIKEEFCVNNSIKLLAIKSIKDLTQCPIFCQIH